MKKALYILSVFLVATLVVGAMLLGALASPKVQTSAVHLVTAELSRSLGTEAEIGGIAYQFPARLAIEDVYVADPAGDTLLYAASLYAHLKPLALLDGQVRFSKICISGLRADAHTLPNGENNYQYLLDLFPQDTTTSESVIPNIALDNVELEDWHIRFQEHEVMLNEASVRLRHLSSDSLNAEILSFNGSYNNGSPHPFRVEDIHAQVIINDTTITAPTLYVALPKSTLDASGVQVTYPANDTIYLSQCASDIRARLHIREADICPSDMQLLIPSAATLDGKIRFTGTLEGSLDSLSATNLAVYYNDYRLIQGDISTVGLPNLHQAYLTAHCEDISLSAGIVQDFVSDLQNHPYILPKEIRRLGNTHYRGTVQGHLTDLTLQGAFRTGLGAITTRGRLISDTTFTQMSFNGRIATRQFRLGELLPQSGLGNITMDIETSGKVHEGGFPEGTIHAHVGELTFRDYTYQDICLHGAYAKQSFDGQLNVDDDNLQLAFNGICDLRRGVHYDFDLKLDKFAPQPLHLTKEDLGLAFNMHVNLTGFDPDRISGYLVIDSLHLRNREDSLLMRQLEIIADCDNTDASPECAKTVQINSDYLTAKVSGRYAYTRIMNSLRQRALALFPSVFSSAEADKIRQLPANNQMQFYIYGRQLKTLQRVLRLPWRIADYPVLRGTLNDKTGQFDIQAYADNLRSQAEKLLNPTFSLLSDKNTAHTDFSIVIPEDTIIVNQKAAVTPEPLYLPRTTLRLHALAGSDSLALTFQANSQGNQENASYGTLALTAKASRYAGAPLFTVFTRPSKMVLQGVPYGLNDGSITYSMAENKLVVNNFRIASDYQYIAANGVASSLPEDSLILELQNIPADPIMPFILSETVLTVQGDVSGRVGLYSLFGNPMFSVDAQVKDVGLNGCRFGDVTATVGINDSHSQILINADIYNTLSDSLYQHKVAHVDGHVEPAEHAWFIDITPDSIPLGFINHWTKAFINDINGTASGSVQVFGREAPVWVTAKVHANDASLTIPFTGCTYHVSDSIFMDSTSIRFPNLSVRDIENNLIRLDGKLSHTYFTNFNLDIQAHPVHALALDLPDKKGDLLSGRIYADGDVYIYGPDNDIHLDASAATYGKSRLRLSIDGASSAHDNSFITFVEHEDSITLLAQREEEKDEFASLKKEVEIKWKPKNKFTLSLSADVNPQLLFELMLNSNTGDKIQARGEGGIRFSMDPNEDINLVGTYTLQSGSLGFTVGNIVRRDFEIAEGSQILFAGNPENPILDVTAKYHVVASLRDLFGDDISSLATTRTSVPVNCCVRLSGPFSDPTIHFAIELPMSEDAIRNQVLSIINTDEMLMRQVVYLLVFGRFFTPEYLQNTGATGMNEVYSILSSTITGQINSWLGKLTNVFTMGVNIRTDGEGASASQEYEAQFQLQPVDRLVINGNVGYRYNDISNRPFFGDVDVEYMLTPNGKFRIKAYTHTVDKYSLRQASTIQGVGFLFRHDFNWPNRKK